MIIFHRIFRMENIQFSREVFSFSKNAQCQSHLALQTRYCLECTHVRCYCGNVAHGQGHKHSSKSFLQCCQKRVHIVRYVLSQNTDFSNALWLFNIIFFRKFSPFLPKRNNWTFSASAKIIGKNFNHLIVFDQFRLVELFAGFVLWIK